MLPQIPDSVDFKQLCGLLEQLGIQVDGLRSFAVTLTSVDLEYFIKRDANGRMLPAANSVPTFTVSVPIRRDGG